VATSITSDGHISYASFPIEKVESTPDGDLMVWGKASDGSVDSDEQIVDPDWAAKGLAEWLATGPNLRVQHQPQRDPAGVGLTVERDGDAHWLKALVVEPVAKKLVQAGALRAYSVGIARPTIIRDSVARGGRITDGTLVEVSLVDRPANKACQFQLVKADKYGHAQFTGKVFGADDVLTKSADDVTITLPQDVQVSFSPLDMAKILARRNGANKDVTTTYHGGVPGGSVPKADDEEEIEKDAVRYDGGVPMGSKADDEGHDMCKCMACKDAGIRKGKLSTEARNKLPDSDFVFPEDRRYPIHDKNHARNALARVAQHGTPEEKAKVRAAVHRRYPGIGQEKPSKKKAAKAAASVAQEALADMTKKGELVKKVKVACMSCGAMQNKAHGYCSECGTKMDSAMPVEKNHDFMCLKCGYKLDKGERHCPGCGSENPGYNPMADLKIPANKMLLTKAAGEDRVPVTKAKKKGKGKPFGGNQAPPFGKDKDGDDGKTEKAKKKKGKVPPVMASEEAAEKGGFGHTASPGEGVTGEHTQSVPRHREPDGAEVEMFERDSGLPTNGDSNKGLGGKTTTPPAGRADMHGTPVNGRGKRKKKSKPSMPTPPGAHGAQGAPGSSMGPSDEEFDRMAGKSADPEVAVTMRLKSLGVDAGMGFLHDLTCPAYKYDDVMKAYPTGLERFSADEWQAKALSAAASAPLAEAQAASQLGQHAFTIKSADVNDLHDVKNDINKAFRDANPGPSSFPTPGHISAQQFQRPHITTGLAAYSHQYDGPNSGHVPSEGGIAASGFTRGNIGGTASQSPAQKGENTTPYPSETGSPVNLNYSSVHKQNLMQAFKAMHDHFDRIMPSGVCPMNAPADGPAAHPLHSAEKGAPEPALAKKVSADGMTKKARKKMNKKLVRAVMKGKMPLDEARIKMGKKPKKSPEPLNPSKSAQPDVTKATTGDADRFTVVMKSEFAAALRKAEKKNAGKIRALTRAVNAMAGQPDPATQAFKGMALNPVRKNASPAGVASIAENAERTQMMILRELESEARNSPYPERREAAWNAVLKMKGLSDLG